MTKKHHIYRNAVTGEICTKEYAEQHPATTVAETLIHDDTHGQTEPVVSPPND